VRQESVWRREPHALQYPALTGPLDVDVAIVGGGLTGITAAYLLSGKGQRIAVLEKSRLGAVATGLTTAFLVETIDTEPETLISIFGEEITRTVFSSHRHAIDFCEQTVRTEGIDCDFSRCPLYMYALTSKDGTMLHRQAGIMRSLGTDASFRSEGNIALPNHGYVRVERQAKFDPLRYLHALAQKAAARGAAIYENTEATGLDASASELATAVGPVRAKHILFATHYPFRKPWQLHFKKAKYISYIYEIRIPTGFLPEALYEDTDNPYHYLRIDRMQDHDRLIIGGADHRADAPVDTEKNFADVEQYARKLLPHLPLTFVRRWIGPIVEPGDGLAYIGPVDSHANVVYATGYSGNGMTYAVIAAEIFAAHVLGQPSAWTEVYAARRPVHLRPHITKAKEYIEQFARGAIKNTFRFAGR
jgi:glycine/D-amino acid oxidase-like deaminating enzyme